MTQEPVQFWFEAHLTSKVKMLYNTSYNNYACEYMIRSVARRLLPGDEIKKMSSFAKFV